MSVLTALRAVPANINPGLNGTKNSLMLSLLGNPRSSYGKDCREVTNPGLKARMKTADVGPFKVTGLDLAVDSLRSVLADVKREEPGIHAALGTAGMLCCRFVRGSSSAISNHSWGTAIDLTVDGVLDQRGNDKVQEGLALIAPIFNRHRWYWGAAFPTEDAMHFEVSLQLLQEWGATGRLTGAPTPGAAAEPDDRLRFGDRGPEVVALQEALNRQGEALTPDGVFGAATHAAVIAFQALNGLVSDGVAGPLTKRRLGL